MFWSFHSFLTEEDILGSPCSFPVLTLGLSISPRNPGLSQWRKVFRCQDPCSRWAHCFCGIAAPRCFQLWELRNVCIMYLHVCISIYLSIYLYISVYLPVCLSIYLSSYLSSYLPTYVLKSLDLSLYLQFKTRGFILIFSLSSAHFGSTYTNFLPFHI